MGLILQAFLIMSIVSILLGLMLIIASKKFKVEEDPKKEQIISILPKANCGACGYVGCEEYAKAIVEENVDITLCKVGGDEVIKKIAEIMNKSVVEATKMVAVVMCQGGINAKDDYVYGDIKSCEYAVRLFDGYKKCKYGCLGFGDCIETCPFDAIFINENKVAQVDPLKCKGCGLCVKSCPQNIIKLIPCRYQVHILCSSQDKGNIVKQICSLGCIGCGLCVKSCPVKDIVLENNLAVMKYNKCNNCGLCVVKCPTDCIVSLLPIENKEKNLLSSLVAK